MHEEHPVEGEYQAPAEPQAPQQQQARRRAGRPRHGCCGARRCCAQVQNAARDLAQSQIRADRREAVCGELDLHPFADLLRRVLWLAPRRGHRAAHRGARARALLRLPRVRVARARAGFCALPRRLHGRCNRARSGSRRVYCAGGSGHRTRARGRVLRARRRDRRSVLARVRRPQRRAQSLQHDSGAAVRWRARHRRDLAAAVDCGRADLRRRCVLAARPDHLRGAHRTLGLACDDFGIPGQSRSARARR